jgi:hypothetical protein
MKAKHQICLLESSRTPTTFSKTVFICCKAFNGKYQNNNKGNYQKKWKSKTFGIEKILEKPLIFPDVLKCQEGLKVVFKKQFSRKNCPLKQSLFF